jgi:hypothetical protein
MVTFLLQELSTNRGLFFRLAEAELSVVDAVTKLNAPRREKII